MSGKNIIPKQLLTHVFTFLSVNESLVIGKVCHSWSRAKYKMGSDEIAELIGDQTKQYALKTIVDHCMQFPDVRELDCRTLVLNPKNPCSEQLIPMLLRARRSWQVVRLPETSQPEENGNSDFFNKVFFTALIHLNFTPNVTTLDLQTLNPSEMRSPFTVIHNQKINTTKITHLLCSDEYAKHNVSDEGSSAQIPLGFPNLETLEIVVRTHGRISMIAALISDIRHLHTLRIVGNSQKPPLSLFSQGTNIFKVPKPKLGKIELVNCFVSEKVVHFLKSIGTPTCALIFKNCSMRLENASLTLTAKDLPSFPKPKEKTESKKSA